MLLLAYAWMVGPIIVLHAVWIAVLLRRPRQRDGADLG